MVLEKNWERTREHSDPKHKEARRKILFVVMRTTVEFCQSQQKTRCKKDLDFEVSVAWRDQRAATTRMDASTCADTVLQHRRTGRESHVLKWKTKCSK